MSADAQHELSRLQPLLVFISPEIGDQVSEFVDTQNRSRQTVTSRFPHLRQAKGNPVFDQAAESLGFNPPTEPGRYRREHITTVKGLADRVVEELREPSTPGRPSGRSRRRSG